MAGCVLTWKHVKQTQSVTMCIKMFFLPSYMAGAYFFFLIIIFIAKWAELKTYIPSPWPL